MRKSVVVVGALVLSLAVGVLAGERFYRVYEDAIPVALKATTSMQGSRIMFWLNGLGLGVVTFGIAIAAMTLGRLTGGTKAPGRTSASDVP
jgi:hypothetical protein